MVIDLPEQRALLHQQRLRKRASMNTVQRSRTSFRETGEPMLMSTLRTISESKSPGLESSTMLLKDRQSIYLNPTSPSNASNLGGLASIPLAIPPPPPLAPVSFMHSQLSTQNIKEEDESGTGLAPLPQLDTIDNMRQRKNMRTLGTGSRYGSQFTAVSSIDHHSRPLPRMPGPMKLTQGSIGMLSIGPNMVNGNDMLASARSDKRSPGIENSGRSKEKLHRQTPLDTMGQLVPDSLPPTLPLNSFYRRSRQSPEASPEAYSNPQSPTELRRALSDSSSDRDHGMASKAFSSRSKSCSEVDVVKAKPGLKKRIMDFLKSLKLVRFFMKKNAS